MELRKDFCLPIAMHFSCYETRLCATASIINFAQINVDVICDGAPRYSIVYSSESTHDSNCLKEHFSCSTVRNSPVISRQTIFETPYMLIEFIGQL